MENDLNGFIRAEMVKKKVPMDVLLSPKGADCIMTGSLVIQEKRSWHEVWLSAEKDHNIANVMVIDLNDRNNRKTYKVIESQSLQSNRLKDKNLE